MIEEFRPFQDGQRIALCTWLGTGFTLPLISASLLEYRDLYVAVVCAA